MNTLVEDWPRCTSPVSCGGQSGATCDSVLPCQSRLNIEEDPPLSLCCTLVIASPPVCPVGVVVGDACGLPSRTCIFLSRSWTYFCRRLSQGAKETVYLHESFRRVQARQTARLTVSTCGQVRMFGCLPGRHPSHRTFLALQFSQAMATLRLSKLSTGGAMLMVYETAN